MFGSSFVTVQHIILKSKLKIQSCLDLEKFRKESPRLYYQSGPYLELFARGKRQNWDVFGNQATEEYKPEWETYKFNSSNRLVS